MKYRLGSGDDDVTGTGGNDVFDGHLRLEGASGVRLGYTGGFDRVSAGGGDDRVYLSTDGGGAGDDEIHVWFNAGDRKVVRAGDGDDLLDIRNYGTTDARISGDAGADTFLYRAPEHPFGLVIMDGGRDADRLLVADNGNSTPVTVRGIDPISIATLVAEDNIRISGALLDRFAEYAADDGHSHQVSITDDHAVSIAFLTDARILGTNHALDLDLTGSTAGVTIETSGRDDSRIVSGAGADTIVVAGGDDIVRGRGGDDVIEGHVGRDTLYGGDGDDALFGGTGTDHLLGGDGNDTLSGVDGLEHDDPEVFDASIDTLIGGAGADTFIGANLDVISYSDSAAAVTVDLAAGTATGGDAAGDVFATQFRSVAGSAFADVLSGSNLSYAYGQIEGGAGDDTLRGGVDADDYIFGQDGNDHIDAGAFVTDNGYGYGTYIDGGAGDDAIAGHATDFRLIGHFPNGDPYPDDFRPDAIVGGDGYDVVDFSADTRATSFNLTMTFGGSEGDNSPEANLAVSGVEYVIASAFSDNVTLDASMVRFDGSDGNDTVRGSAPDQLINGQAGDDSLAGGDGNDTLAGGTGQNSYSGGSGNDVFRVGAAGHVSDTVTDFAGGQDRIDLTFYQTKFTQLAFTPVDGDADGAIDDVRIAVGHGADSLQLTLVNTTAAALTATDFIF